MPILSRQNGVRIMVNFNDRTYNAWLAEVMLSQSLSKSYLRAL